MLGEVLPSDGTGGSGGSGLIWSDASVATDAACGEPTDLLVQLVPALYMVIDRSTDMQTQQGNKWSDLVDAVSSYLSPDPGWEVGFGVYPNPCGLRLSPMNPMCQGGGQICSPSSYNVPNAAIGPAGAALLPWNNVDFYQPGGFPAMRLALDAALQTVIPSWERANPTKFAVPVIIAGAGPNDNNNPCSASNDITTVANSAANADLNPPFNRHSRTFVIGFETNDDTPLDRIANEGGTNNALMVDGNRVSMELTGALDSIRQRSCMFQLPQNAPKSLVLGMSTPGDGGMQGGILGFVNNRDGCGRARNGAPSTLPQWYYDPDDASRIIGCDQTCEALAEQPGAGLQIIPECQIAGVR